jgi:hypothetical protein
MLTQMVGIFVLERAFDGLPVYGWLVSSDPDAFKGRGDAQFTTDPSRAKRFVDAKAALQYWRRESTVQPYRDDGKPNRPLTAYTVEVKPLPETVQ